MLAKGNVLKGGLAFVAAYASLAAPQTANAQTYSRSYRTYRTPVTYVNYQPTRYAPVYTDRQVVYTAPTYVERAPVREVVRYVPQPVRTRTVYVEPRQDYYPLSVSYSSGHRYGHSRYYGGSHYGYRTGHRGSHYGSRHFGHRRHHRSRSFHLSVGGLHIGRHRGYGGHRGHRGYRGHRGGFSLRLGR